MGMLAVANVSPSSTLRINHNVNEEWQNFSEQAPFYTHFRIHSHLSLMGLISETGFHCLAQDGFRLNPPASTFQDLGLRACAVMCFLSYF